MNEDFGRARIQQFEQMIANAPPRGRGRPHRVRFALGRALIQSGSRLLSEEGRVRVA
ncbi:MAG: hypothetical protein HKN95_06190 [Acidimicrobiia bacterium]|nr:hypothetical protein [Acidimicrobiia bacterium]